MLVRRTLRFILIVFATLLFVNLVLVPIFEPKILYQIKQTIDAYPDSIGLNYEDVYLLTADGKKINGWYLKNVGSDKVILYLKGNAENISGGLTLATINLLFRLPSSVMVIDYHGYGKSEGSPSERSLYLDAETAYDFLVRRKGYHPEDVFVVGNSLGGAVAIDLALKKRIGGLVLQRTFTSMADMAAKKNPFYRFPMIWIRNVYNSKARIKGLKIPVIIAHAKNDKIIPYWMAVELYKNAPEAKKLFLFDKGGHDEVFSAPEYVRSLKEMMR